MTNQSGLATREFILVTTYHQHIAEIVTDEPEIKLCHGCGEPDTRETCLCSATTKVRLVSSEIIRAQNFDWMSKEVLRCDEFDLKNYIFTAFHYSPSRQFMQLLKDAKIDNYAECANCKTICTPEKLSGIGSEIDSLCTQCAKEEYGH